MNIDLGNDYRLSADKYQWMIQKMHMAKNSKTGELEEKWDSLSYHSTINQAINHHAGVLIRTSEAESVGEAMEAIESVVAGLTQALSPVFDVNVHRGDK